MIFENIQFQQKFHKLRILAIPNYGDVKVGLISLNDILINENHNYVSNEAKLVDEEIFCFLTPEQFELSDLNILKIIENEIW